MSYREFGERQSFALISDGTMLQIYIAGKHLTEFDDKPYWPAIINHLQSAHERLRKCLNFLMHQQYFASHTVEGAHACLLKPEPALEDVQSKLRFADWGPITDGYVCFLIPINEVVYMTCGEPGQKVSACQIWPYDIATTIHQFLAHPWPNQSFQRTASGGR